MDTNLAGRRALPPASDHPHRLHSRYRTAQAVVPLVSVANFAVRKMGLVHDLRNLLQVTASALELIDREVDRGAGPEVHRLTHSGLLSIRRAAALSSEILDASCASGGTGGSVDLSMALATMRDLISLAAGPSIAIDMFLGDKLASVRCDRGEFEDVILNLVANARDAMPEGGRLTISLFDGSGCPGVPGLAVSVQVTDSGGGMSEATAKRALDPFFTTKGPHKGTGLGLAMVHSFAVRAGGSVQIESALGRGTSVILTLPGVATLF